WGRLRGGVVRGVLAGVRRKTQPSPVFLRRVGCRVPPTGSGDIPERWPSRTWLRKNLALCLPPSRLLDRDDDVAARMAASEVGDRFEGPRRPGVRWRGAVAGRRESVVLSIPECFPRACTTGQRLIPSGKGRCRRTQSTTVRG